MLVIRDLESIPKLRNAVLTIGTFDGIHLGHKKLLEAQIQFAKQNNSDTILITFEPHPRLVLQKDNKPLYLLNTLEHKIVLIEELGFDYLVIIDFTLEFAETSYQDFVKDYLIDKFQVKHLFIGYDHQFGKDRKGNFDELMLFAQEYNFEIHRIEAEQLKEINISSTKIRNFLIEGNIKSANAFLGYNYTLSGKVIHGDGRGKTIGFPTANIEVEDSLQLIPANGVYAVWVEVEEKLYKGMMNIGVRPTFNLHHKTLEINLIDFNQDIYAKKIIVKFVDKLRNEVKFESVNMLIEQLFKDKQLAINTLQKEEEEIEQN